MPIKRVTGCRAFPSRLGAALRRLAPAADGGRGFLDFDPFLRPAGDRVDRRRERPALFGQRVFDTDRRLRDDRALDDPFLLELLQPLAEHAVGDLGDGVAQHREATARFQQHVDDRPGPAAADQLAGAVEAQAELRDIITVAGILRHDIRIAPILENRNLLLDYYRLPFV